jgi:hypothetical protein
MDEQMPDVFRFVTESSVFLIWAFPFLWPVVGIRVLPWDGMFVVIYDTVFD